MVSQGDRSARIDILIAEADAPARQDLRHLLEREGYTCAEAATAAEAVELARQYQPPCVLLDLRLPEPDGSRVADHLRADPRTHGAAIHCLAEQPDPAARAEAARAGCDLIVIKPVDVGALLQVVHQDLGRPEEWVRDLTKAEAEDLLDWLENNGVAGRLRYEDGRGFAVCCPGLRAERDARGQLLLWPQTGPTGT